MDSAGRMRAELQVPAGAAALIVGQKAAEINAKFEQECGARVEVKPELPATDASIKTVRPSQHISRCCVELAPLLRARSGAAYHDVATTLGCLSHTRQMVTRFGNDCSVAGCARNEQDIDDQGAADAVEIAGDVEQHRPYGGPSGKTPGRCIDPAFLTLESSGPACLLGLLGLLWSSLGFSS
eukprot:3539995-Rhodomonas_salina.1